MTIKQLFLKSPKKAGVAIFLLAFFLLSVSIYVPTQFALADDYGGGSVAGYAADAPIENNRIVQLTDQDSKKVKLATRAESEKVFGVSVAHNQLPFIVTNEGVQNETFVATSGKYNVLVSTQAGEIKSGDYLTVSSIDGVAMRAGEDEVTVFGRANASFDGRGVVFGSQVLTDEAGQTQTVSLGSVPVTIDIKNNPNHKSTDTNLPEFLTRAGQAIAEKEISPLRMYLSLAIAAVSLIASIAMLYAGVRNSVISIGRNPMSRKSIFKALLQVILTSLLILFIGLFAVYLLLRL